MGNDFQIDEGFGVPRRAKAILNAEFFQFFAGVVKLFNRFDWNHRKGRPQSPTLCGSPIQMMQAADFTRLWRRTGG